MILIADAGSTKTAWCLVNDAGEMTQTKSAGINPVTMPREDIEAVVNDELMPWLNGVCPGAVFYYGAGVISDRERSVIKDALQVTGARSCEVESDMTGAARALLGNSPGIACILGTGSNSCLYDGNRIVDNIPPLGYILGDEGSGASLGKRFVGDLFKRLLPTEIVDEWNRCMGLDMQQVIGKVYREPSGNRFLASLVPFINTVKHAPEVKQLIMEEFDRFFVRNVERYSSQARHVGFVGSIAVHFSAELEDITRQHGYEITRILDEPIDNLVDYHKRQLDS